MRGGAIGLKPRNVSGNIMKYRVGILDCGVKDW